MEKVVLICKMGKVAKIFQNALFLILTSICITACATGVDHVKLYDPLSYDPLQESGVTIAHADVPKVKPITDEKIKIGIGRIKDNRPDISSIGVKKNTYGMAMGKVDVEETVVFLELFKNNLINCFTKAGYEAIPIKEIERSTKQEKEEIKALMEAEVRTFWVEFMPGFFVVDAASNVIFEVRLIELQTNREIWSEIFRGKGKVSSGIAVTRDMFEKSINMAYAEAMRSLYTTISDEKTKRVLNQ
jgi:hypothetical protein